MDIKIVEIKDEKLKPFYANNILRRLPEWFGNEQALSDYVTSVTKLPFWAAVDQNGDCVGFMTVKIHYGITGDIFVCGVLPEYHNKGIGKKLITLIEDYLKHIGCKFMIVKTLSEAANYEPYERTRQFYIKVGFEKLITLTEMWDADNPCLVMIKKL